jgi:hypothetical protein
MPSSAARVHRGILLTVLYVGVTFAHAQELRSIESINQSYLTCVQSTFVQHRHDLSVSSLPQAAEQAFLDCQSEEDALYDCRGISTRKYSSYRPGPCCNRTNLKAELLAAPPTTGRK